MHNMFTVLKLKRLEYSDNMDLEIYANINYIKNIVRKR